MDPDKRNGTLDLFDFSARRDEQLRLGDESFPQPRKPKTVAVLFSGGDAPGMNAFLRYFVRLGLHRHQARVVGVKDGFAGLVRTAARLERGPVTVTSIANELSLPASRDLLFDRSRNLLQLDHVSVCGLVSRGGITLGAARCPEFLVPGERRKVAELLRQLDVDALVAVGGNGTLAGARAISAETRTQVIGVPATIDNDVSCTETTLGFDTAVNVTMHAMEQLNDTAASHHRIMIVETMGRDCGDLARVAALAAGAEIVVAPERGLLTERKMQGIARRLEQSFARGQTHALVVVAEGVQTDDPACERATAQLRKFLEARFGTSPLRRMEVRDTVLGHVQRGGSPTAADRLLAARFADAVWMTLVDGAPRSGIAVVRDGKVVVEPFVSGDSEFRKNVQLQLYSVQKAVSAWVR